MSEPMEIEIGAGGVTDATGAVKDLSGALLEADGNLNQLLKTAQELKKTAAAPRSRKAEADKADADASKDGPENTPAAKEAKFLQGANQKLLKIAEQRMAAEQLADEKHRKAVLADLEIAEARAKRSKVLGERLVAGGEEAINGKGLLQLFTEMNGLLGNLKRGDLAGAGKTIFRGMSLIEGGGLNIEQKLRKTVGGSGLGEALGKAAPGTAATLGDFILPGAEAAGAGAAGAAAGGAEAAGAAGALGLGALGGPVGLALAAGVIALTVEFTALEKGAEALGHAFAETVATQRDFSAARTVSGATAGEAARLTALGLAPGAAAGNANSLRGRLASDPLAQLTFSQMGGGLTLPQAYGPQDNAKLYQQALEGLRTTYQTEGAEEALRRARILGMEGDLELIKVSEHVWQAQKREAALREAIWGNPQIEQAARDLAAESGLFSQKLQDIGGALLGPWIPEAEQTLAGLNVIGEELVQWAEAAGPAIHGMVDLLIDQIPGAELLRGVQALGAGGDHADAAQTAAEAQIDSQDKLRTSIEKLTQVTGRAYGGGKRTEELMRRPWMQNPNAFSDSMDAGTATIGEW